MPSPSFINGAGHAESISHGTTASVTLNGVLQGSLLLVAFGSDATANTGLVMNDSAGNVYTQWDAVQQNGISGECVFLFAAVANSSTNLVITASGADFISFRRLIIASQFTRGRQDGFVAAHQNGVTSLSASLIPNTPDMFLTVCMCSAFPGANLDVQSPFTGFGKVFSSDTTGMAAGYATALPPGATTATWTTGTTDTNSFAFGIWGISSAIAVNPVTGGGFQDSEGNPLANGYLIFRLTADGQAFGVGQICSGANVTVPLDSTGNATGSVGIWPNDVLLPSDTKYNITAYSAAGQPVWQSTRTILSSPSPFPLED